MLATHDDAAKSGTVDPPFGTFALPKGAEMVRRFAAGGHIPLLSDALRKAGVRSARTRTEPVDILSDGLRLRLQPSDNNCERKFLYGSRRWNGPERAALTKAVQDASEDFVFVDVGANVGLFTLHALGAGRALGRSVHAIAIEPDPINRSRLATNLTLNGFHATVLGCAVGDAAGTAALTDGTHSRGTVQLAAPGSGRTPVAVRPLLDLALEQKLSRIDALKIDIEGLDEAVLAAFYGTAPRALFPRLLIAETCNSVADLLRTNGYHVLARTRSNTVMVLTEGRSS